MTHIKCKIVGLTGGIASGKSTVSQILRDNGKIVIDADHIAKKVVNIGGSAYYEIIQGFGKDLLSPDNSINRNALGKLIFSNWELRQKLNDITHPYIFAELVKEVNNLCQANGIIFLDIPLLFESYDNIIKAGIVFDEIWLVYVDEQTQISRLMKRDNLDREEGLQRIGSQMFMNEKIKLADVIIDNSGNVSMLKPKVLKSVKVLEQSGGM